MERYTAKSMPFFLLVLTLSACGGSSPVYVAPPEDTDSDTGGDTDSDSDGDSDTDTDTDTDTDADTDTDTDTDNDIDVDTDTDIDTDMDIDTDTDTDTDSDGDTDTSTPPEGTWTLMFYFDGDNNLDDVIADDVDTLEDVDIPPWLDVVLLWDRLGSGDTTLYEVTGSGDKTRLADPTYLGLSDTGDDELNMGDPATLEGLIDFSQAAYPADNYGLFLSDHGDGWSKKSAGDSEILKGTCTDETSDNDSLSVQTEIRPAIAGKGLDAIGFDACLMAMIETAWALKDDASYLVGSQKTEPGEGWDYFNWLTDWIDAGTDGGRGLVIDEVITYGEYYDGEWGVTQSAIDLSMLPALGEALDAFVAADDPGDHLGDDMSGWSGLHYYDIWEMADDAGDTALRAAVEDAVIQNWHSGSGTAPGGLSIFFENGFPEAYTSTPFCADTDWC